MEGLKNFIQIPLVKFFIHFFLVFGIVVNITNLYISYKMSNRIEAEKEVLENLIQQNNQSRNQKDYYNSELYRERYAKESNYKKKGEQVIDTTDIEITFNQTSDYVPEIVTKEQGNADRWWRCVFGYATPINVENNKYLESLCRW